ncbi:MAG: VWA domain-containing protein [Leptospiraceae bacterium]
MQLVSCRIFNRLILLKLVPVVLLLLSSAILAKPDKSRSKGHFVSVVLVLDISGSMSVNDPDRLSWDAANLMANLLSQGDEIGLVLFNHEVVSTLGPLRIGQDNISRDTIKERLSGRYNGGTDILGAVNKGMDMLGNVQSSPRRKKAILVLTDGADQSSLDSYRAAHLRSLNQGITIFPVAMGTEPSKEKLLALTDESELLQANQPQELPDTFSIIYARLFDSMISRPQGTGTGFVFQAHPLTAEMNLILSDDDPGSLNFTVYDPAGKALSSNEARHGKKFISLQIVSPTPGEWKVQTTRIPDNMSLLQIADLKLEVKWGDVSPLKKTITVDQARLLTENGTRILDEERYYRGTRFELVVRGPGGEKTYELRDDGQGADRQANDRIFAGTGKIDGIGQYSYYVRVHFPVFKPTSERYFLALQEKVWFRLKWQTNAAPAVQQGQILGLPIQITENKPADPEGENIHVRLHPKSGPDWNSIELLNTELNVKERSPGTVRIRPDYYRGIDLGLFSATPGTYEGELEFFYPGQDSVRLPVKFEVRSAPFLDKLLGALIFWSCIALVIAILMGLRKAVWFPRKMRIFLWDEHGQRKRSSDILPRSKWLYGKSSLQIGSATLFSRGHKSTNHDLYYEEDGIRQREPVGKHQIILTPAGGYVVVSDGYLSFDQEMNLGDQIGRTYRRSPLSPEEEVRIIESEF